MSNKNKDASVSAQQEELELLRDALIREKNLTKKLQSKLEEKAQQSFDKNKAFLDAYEQANLRQIQLQFLSSLTQNIYQADSVENLTKNYLDNIFDMLDVNQALVFVKRNQSILARKYSQAGFSKMPKASKQSVLNLFSHFASSIPDSANWIRLEPEQFEPLTEVNLNQSAHFPIACYLKIAERLEVILVLEANHYCYSESFKQTLDTSCQQFSASLQRRVAELELAENYQSLKHALEELKDTQHQLAHSKKMSSLGQLSAGVAHEINNPLGYITSNLETLKDYISLFSQALAPIETDKESDFAYARDDIKPLINSCIDGLKRISEIVMSLKTFSKKDSEDMAPLNLAPIIEESLKIVKNQFKYQHSIVNSLPEKLPEILGNAGQIQQIFVNLFMNAAHAMPDGGTLNIDAAEQDNLLSIAISDTGIGMTKETISKLFEPFFTTKTDFGGTGLGLSLSYALIEKHHGTISVESTPGKGSTFTLRFPFAKH